MPVLTTYQSLQKGEPLEMEIRGDLFGRDSRPPFPSAGRRARRDPRSGLPHRKTLDAARPVFLRRLCNGCKVCVEVCPAHCLDYEEGWGVRFRESECIRCFCCQEMCPSRAISVKKPRLSLFSK